ncbi:MAG: SDR family oxidoreductase [Chitinophagaceae bacterium]|nr:SDR family oxidoreductase [Chitinophagaceae bacterium]
MNVKQLLSLKDKIILVTGGAGHYGKCIAEGLAEADATVIIASRDLEKCRLVAKEFQDRKLNVHAMRLDQGDHNSIIELKKNILSQFGKLHGLINNAVSRPMKDYDAPIAQFSESMQVNATGVMDITRELVEVIVESGGGSIVNIGSIMGLYGPDLSNYAGTDMSMKPPPDYYFHNAGLLNLTRYLAQMLADKNVRVNCVSPGGLLNNQPPQFIENYRSKVPLKRMANRDDIKGLMVLLTSEAGAYINGTNIVMDGGLNA